MQSIGLCRSDVRVRYFFCICSAFRKPGAWASFVVAGDREVVASNLPDVSCALSYLMAIYIANELKFQDVYLQQLAH